MRIVFVCHQFPLLSETFILKRVMGLLERGHDVQIISEIPSGHVPSEGDWVRYDLAKRVFCLKGKTRVPIFASDIIQACFGPLGNLASRLRDEGIVQGRLAASFHGYDLSQTLKKYGEGCYSELFQKGDLFLPVSEKFKNVLLRLGCPPSKIKVLRTGIDPARFAFKPAREANEPFRLLSAGRLVEKKGFAYAVEAVRKVLDAGHSVSYAIIGEGVARLELGELIHRFRLKGHVTLLGAKPPDEVVQAMRSADALLAPSVEASDGNQEGIPNPLKEAMASGLPVVSTYHSGIPELVKHRASGLLVEERNAAQLAEAIIELKQDRALRERLVVQARAEIEAHYDIRKLNDRLERFYQDLLA